MKQFIKNHYVGFILGILMAVVGGCVWTTVNLYQNVVSSNLQIIQRLSGDEQAIQLIAGRLGLLNNQSAPTPAPAPTPTK